MKASEWCRCMAPFILNIGTGWKIVDSFTPWTLDTRWWGPRYPLSRRVCRPKNSSGHFREEKNSPLPIIKPDSLVAQAVAQSLYWLSHPYTKHIQLCMSMFFIMRYDCLKANRESLGGVCPIPLPGRQIDLQKSLRRSICFIIFPYFCQFWPSASACCSSLGRKMYGFR